MTMKFGNITETADLDENGSTVAVTKAVKDGVVMPMVRKRYDIRHKVTTVEQEVGFLLEFSQKVHANPLKMLDPAFKSVGVPMAVTKGYWYVVCSHTEVEK
ncbi:hypothetical protein I8H89_00365 [Candidatus Saccharibacteria bacterium]|nr:hypothetical protein [Candidatus Saccharibacteria bacterium]